MSDNHGALEDVQKVIAGDAEAPSFLAEWDAIFHCGDYCSESGLLPTGVHRVRGNCDVGETAPEEQAIQWRGLNILLVHGHLYQVNSSLLPLKYRAEELGCNVILYGHTHHPLCIQGEGRVFINPGSMLSPRGYPRPTFAVMEWEPEKMAERVASGTDNGPNGLSPVKGKLDVVFYNLSMGVEEKLCKSFTLG